jgi:hypothetical protein
MRVSAPQHHDVKIPGKRSFMSIQSQLITASRLLHKQKDCLPDETTTI